MALGSNGFVSCTPGGIMCLLDAYGVEQHRKAAFPTGAVYGPTSQTALRLITCGGPFDPVTHHYVDNYVVVARPAA